MVWITPSNFIKSPRMNGLFLFWTPIKKNRYFVLEKVRYLNNSNTTTTPNTTTNTPSPSSNTNVNTTSSSSHKGNHTTSQGNTSTSTTTTTTTIATTNTNNSNSISDINTGIVGRIFYVTWNQVISRLLPSHWRIDPNVESYRIKCTLNAFDQYQISTSNDLKDIMNDWSKLDIELFPSLKKITTTEEKNTILSKYITKQLLKKKQ